MRNSMMRLAAISVVACSANAFGFVNGNFELGSLSGWNLTSTTNGTTNYNQVEQWDIDGPGPKGTNFAARFNVGQVVFTSGVPAGIELTQSLSLIGGTSYLFSYDFSSNRLGTSGTNAQGGIFDLIVNGASIANFAVGTIAFGQQVSGSLSGSFLAPTTGSYTVGARITRPFVPATTIPLFQSVDNFAVVPEPGTMAALGLGALAMLKRRKKG